MLWVVSSGTYCSAVPALVGAQRLEMGGACSHFQDARDWRKRQEAGLSKTLRDTSTRAGLAKLPAP